MQRRVASYGAALKQVDALLAAGERDVFQVRAVSLRRVAVEVVQPSLELRSSAGGAARGWVPGAA